MKEKTFPTLKKVTAEPDYVAIPAANNVLSVKVFFAMFTLETVNIIVRKGVVARGKEECGR